MTSKVDISLSTTLSGVSPTEIKLYLSFECAVRVKISILLHCRFLLYFQFRDCLLQAVLHILAYLAFYIFMHS